MYSNLLKEASENILQQQQRSIDQHLFSWLASQGCNEKTEKGIKKFLDKKNLELIADQNSTEAGTTYTYKLVKVISKTKLLLKTPKIIIED